MTSSSQSCCVCLNNFFSLNTLSKTDRNDVILLEKLKINVPQIEWHISYQLCEPCANLLDIVHTFRETCIKSDVIRKLQLETIIEPTVEPYYIKSEDLQNSFESDLHIDIKEEIKNEDGYDDPNVFSNSDGDEKKFEVNLKLEITEEKLSPPKNKQKMLRFQCEKCPNSYVSSTILIRHCVEEHGMESKNVQPFACTRCSKRFRNAGNRLNHIKYHEAVKSNICTYCGKGFVTKVDLKTHEKQHLNKREYKCEICTKSFNTHKNLRSHNLVVHTEPQLWKYSCETCDKRFPIKSNYDTHMRRHTGEKKFECQLCDKRFTDRCELQRHMRSHSDVRDFKCSECEKEYKDKRVMQIHLVKVHGIGVGEVKLPSKERKYNCHLCPKAYYAKNKLTRHLYTHSGEKPFFCTICFRKFNDKSYVKQHMRKSHNVNTDADK